MADARKLAEQFHAELDAQATSADNLLALIRKYYADDVEQNEAGQEVWSQQVSHACMVLMWAFIPIQPTKGLEAVLGREKFVFDNYFDWSVPVAAPRVIVHSIHADGNVTFTNHTFRGAFKGAGIVGM